MVALTEAAHRLGADERTFRRAVATGTVRCHERSPRRRQLDDEELAYLSGHWELLSKLRAALRTEPNVRLAVLYGSAARGDDRDDSDADVLVSFAEDRPLARIRLAGRLMQALDRHVDVAQLDRVDETAPLLLLQVVDEGRVIVDRDGVWPGMGSRRTEIERRAFRAHAENLRQARRAIRELLAEDE
ncbi:MAG: nucleotidyltransferase domain-containing protein [Actinobacteria bacterium]|nr:nucleotidyltransferase domain-containing protein [Actinomycetota bacterium]